LFPIANHLFATLAVIEIAWCGIWWAIEKQDTHSLWAEALKKFVSIGLFYAILLNSNQWIPAIIKSFMMIGQGASHQYNLYPSDVMDQGISIAGNIFKVFHDTGLMSFGISTLVGAFCGLMTLFSFCLIAALLVVTLVESYIVLGAGVLMLGFASNRMSAKFATNSMSYAMGVGAKLFMLYLVLGIGGSLANDWISKFQQLSSIEMSPFLEIAGGSLVYLFVAWAIPSKAEAIMSGATNATLGGVVAATSVASTAASIVSGGVSGATRAVMGSASSGVEAVKQGGSVAHALGGGMKGFAIGAMVSGANLASTTLGGMVGHHASASSAMKQKTGAIKQFFANRAEQNVSDQSRPSRPTKVNPPQL
jgi:type IV secretion system protein TrbL